MAAPASSPRRQPPEHPSHGDILHAIAELQKDVGVIIIDVKGVKDAVAEVQRCLGHEEEDARGVTFGTGLVGRHIRLQARVDGRFKLYDDWRNLAIGCIATLTLMTGVVWWLVQNKLDEVLR
jgi:hypothetical protein